MPPPPACDEQDDQWGNTRYFLAIVSVFKNEADVIREWVEHHLWQGVEHFFLVDNGSTDKWREALGERMPHVSVARNETLYSQVSHLNSWLSRLQAEVRWVLSIDVDEYVYAHPSRGSESIDAYLRHVEQADCKARKISLAWHQFGSSGYVQQPPSVRRFFTRSAANASLGFGGKYVVRTSAVQQLRVHDAVRIQGQQREWWMNRISPPLVLNHYSIMSRDRFVQVKMTRGDVAAVKLLGTRTLTYFERYDKMGDEIDNLDLKMLLERACSSSLRAKTRGGVASCVAPASAMSSRASFR